jgi:hypothetical protein
MEETRCCVKKLEDYVSFDVTIDEMFFRLYDGLCSMIF